MDLKFLSLLGVNDLVRLALQALPFAALMLAASYELLIELTWVQRKPPSHDGAKVQTESRRQLLRLSSVLGLVWMFFAAFLASRSGLPSLLFVTGLLITVIVYFLKSIEENTGSATNMVTPIYLSAVSFCFFVAGFGASAALAELEEVPGSYCFAFAGSTDTRIGALFFRSDSGYLLSLDEEIVKGQRVVTFFPTEKVSKICRYLHEQPSPAELIWRSHTGLPAAPASVKSAQPPAVSAPAKPAQAPH